MRAGSSSVAWSMGPPPPSRVRAARCPGPRLPEWERKACQALGLTSDWHCSGKHLLRCSLTRPRGSINLGSLFARNPMLAIEFASLSDRGRVRLNNEDARGQFVPETTAELEERGVVFVVADGM